MCGGIQQQGSDSSFFIRWGDSQYCYLFPGKGDSLRLLQDEILQKSTKLEGLDAKLRDLLAKLRKKAYDLSTCQGWKSPRCPWSSTCSYCCYNTSYQPCTAFTPSTVRKSSLWNTAIILNSLKRGDCFQRFAQNNSWNILNIKD